MLLMESGDKAMHTERLGALAKKCFDFMIAISLLAVSSSRAPIDLYIGGYTHYD